MRPSQSDAFVCEFGLRVGPAYARELAVRLEAARQVYNASLQEALRRVGLLRESRAWQAARSTTGKRARSVAFRLARETGGFTRNAMIMTAHRTWQDCPAIHDHLDCHSAQVMGKRAFAATEQYLFGQRGKPRFKPVGQVDSVEGDSNQYGIRLRQAEGRWQVEWKGLFLPLCFRANDTIRSHALGCRVKYVRLVRRKGIHRDRYYAQLVLAGRPLLRIQAGMDVVGLDLGPSQVAVVGESRAMLLPLAGGVAGLPGRLAVLQRQSRRQLRANNPHNFNLDGTIRPGRKRWHRSHRAVRVMRKVAGAQRRLAAQRKTELGWLSNRVVEIGRFIKTEKVSYRAFQRVFGKSVGRHAPGAFISMLGRRAESAGGYLQEFPTRTTRLSQTCQCGRVAKKALSQRVHRCPCGVQAQRDLYSAFLARCVDANGVLRPNLARQDWDQGAGELLHAAEKAKFASLEGTSRRHRATGRSEWRAQTDRCGCAEARDAVPAGGGGESPREA